MTPTTFPVKTRDWKQGLQGFGDFTDPEFEVPAEYIKNAVRLLVDYNNQVEESNEQNNSVIYTHVGTFPSPGK